MDDVVLNYHDSLLRNSDVKLLEEGNWLNDNIIGFMFEYFRQELFSRDDILFLDPDFAQLIKLSQNDEALSLLSTVGLNGKCLIFISVNNNRSTTVAGGTHWSLLVYDAALKCFEHYDSCAQTNEDEAKYLAKLLSQALSVTPKLEDKSFAEQKNSSDCGVYVIKTASVLCSSKIRQEPCDFSAITPTAVASERQRIKQLIMEKSSAGR
uniref:Sentrin-specific protease 8-like n=1 Tax=Phallusia mammillata TaxID=59560 RepID=A0A6F9DRA2_9ASCI|nr:sentrin-specific protease 8-like [Phallusia mammillata]